MKRRLYFRSKNRTENVIILNVIESKDEGCYNKRNKKVVFVNGGVLL